MWEKRQITDSIDAIHQRFIALMDRYETPLYKFLFVVVGDRDVALDCTQDAFVRAYENLSRGRPVNAQWLYTVGRNRAMDEFRRRRRESPDLETLELLPDRCANNPETATAMRQAFAHLDADDRSALYLSAVEGLTGAEIAEMLGISHAAVRMRVFRARERFRQAYGVTA